MPGKRMHAKTQRRKGKSFEPGFRD